MGPLRNMPRARGLWVSIPRKILEIFNWKETWGLFRSNNTKGRAVGRVHPKDTHTHTVHTGILSIQVSCHLKKNFFNIEIWNLARSRNCQTQEPKARVRTWQQPDRAPKSSFRVFFMLDLISRLCFLSGFCKYLNLWAQIESNPLTFIDKELRLKEGIQTLRACAHTHTANVTVDITKRSWSSLLNYSLRVLLNTVLWAVIQLTYQVPLGQGMLFEILQLCSINLKALFFLLQPTVLEVRRSRTFDVYCKNQRNNMGEMPPKTVNITLVFY